jgi:hypothetical protein
VSVRMRENLSVLRIPDRLSDHGGGQFIRPHAALSHSDEVRWNRLCQLLARLDSMLCVRWYTPRVEEHSTDNARYHQSRHVLRQRSASAAARSAVRCMLLLDGSPPRYVMRW